MEPLHELKPGGKVERDFVIASNILKTAKTGKHYLELELRDRTGRISAKKWDASPDMFEQLPAGTAVFVEGRVDEWQGKKQIIANSIRALPPEEVDYTRFMSSTERDTDEMFARVREILDGVSHADLRRLADAFLSDEELMELFRLAPAAMALHQAYLGGLLEHTLSLLELAERVLPHYLALDADLVRVGVFLHDIGKTRELSYERAIGYSDEGRLAGHLVLGAEMLARKVEQLDGFPHKLFRAVHHIILSHHGKIEWGSIKQPMFAEAVLVHHLDNIDAKMAAFAEIMEREGAAGELWTGPQYMFDNARLYKGVFRAFGEDESEEPETKPGTPNAPSQPELPF